MTWQDRYVLPLEHLTADVVPWFVDFGYWALPLVSLGYGIVRLIGGAA